MRVMEEEDAPRRDANGEAQRKEEAQGEEGGEEGAQEGAQGEEACEQGVHEDANEEAQEGEKEGAQESRTDFVCRAADVAEVYEEGLAEDDSTKPLLKVFMDWDMTTPGGGVSTSVSGEGGEKGEEEERERVERERREERKRNEVLREIKGALCTALWEAGGGTGKVSIYCPTSIIPDT